jgi:hypothetical protein
MGLYRFLHPLAIQASVFVAFEQQISRKKKPAQGWL